MSIFTVIEEKLDELNANFASIPTWIPITTDFAKQNGYKTVDGLRSWCKNHLPPDMFDKRGKHWCVNKSAVRLIKDKIALM